MAIPVLESSNTATSTASDTVTITKPTGLAVGDLMLVQLGSSDISAADVTWNTPSGWTAVEVGSTSSLSAVPACFYKIADSGDAAASNFAFTMSGATTAISGCLMRITGHVPATPVTISEIDQVETGGTTLTATTALTPAVTNSLLVFAYTGAGNAFTSGTPSMTSYASTPSATWTEVADVGIKNGSDDGHGLGVAQADYSGTTEITSRTATISQSANTSRASIAVIVNGTVDANTTPTFASSTQSTFALAAVRADTDTTPTFAASTQTANTPTGYADSPPSFTNKAKPAAPTWTNPDKP